MYDSWYEPPDDEEDEDNYVDNDFGCYDPDEDIDIAQEIQDALDQFEERFYEGA